MLTTQCSTFGVLITSSMLVYTVILQRRIHNSKNDSFHLFFFAPRATQVGCLVEDTCVTSSSTTIQRSGHTAKMTTKFSMFDRFCYTSFYNSYFCCFTLCFSRSHHKALFFHYIWISHILLNLIFLQKLQEKRQRFSQVWPFSGAIIREDSLLLVALNLRISILCLSQAHQSW